MQKEFALFDLHGFYYKSFKCFNWLHFHWKKRCYEATFFNSFLTNLPSVGSLNF